MPPILDVASSSLVRIVHLHPHTSLSKFAISFVGLLCVGLSVALWGNGQIKLVSSQDTAMLSVFMAVAVLGFGMSSVLSWRQKGDVQEIGFEGAHVVVRSSQLKQALFSFPITATKLQCFHLPGGRQQLFLRTDEMALEIGQSLTPDQQNKLAEHLEMVLGVHAPLGFARKDG